MGSLSQKRSAIREKLSELYVPFYDRLCELLPPVWQPYSGYRSFVDQDAKFAQGRTSRGGRVTNARGGESAHNYGCATDWTIWTDQGMPLWLTKEDLHWAEYINAVTQVGLRPGAEFGDVDHNELRLTCSWKEIHNVFLQSGLPVANLAIRGEMVTHVEDDLPTNA